MSADALPTADIVELSAAQIEARLPELAEVLRACVAAGASVNFVMPFGPEDSERFFRERVLPGARAGIRFVFAALIDGRLVGTVQLDLATQPNQPHRTDVTKLLVHPDFRRRGIARVLMLALEGKARSLGRTLLTLDTRTGDAAEPLYVSLGYVPIGIIPGFSRDVFSDRFDATTLMYRQL